MQPQSAAPTAMLASLWRNRRLLRDLVRRDIAGRYRGSYLGVAWSVFHPMVMLAVYTFVFSVVFNARWGQGSGSRLEFALLLFMGLIVFNFVAECLGRAPDLVVSNANYVKRVVFPLEMLPLVTVGTAGFHALINLGVWLAAFVLSGHVPGPAMISFPLIMLPVALVTLGAVWGLSSLGVYLRDLGQVIGVVITALMFLSPIFYPVSALPERLRAFAALNPMAVAIEQARDVMFWGHWPEPAALALQLVVAAVVAWGGFAWFQKTRNGFADVL